MTKRFYEKVFKTTEYVRILKLFNQNIRIFILKATVIIRFFGA